MNKEERMAAIMLEIEHVMRVESAMRDDGPCGMKAQSIPYMREFDDLYDVVRSTRGTVLSAKRTDVDINFVPRYQIEQGDDQHHELFSGLLLRMPNRDNHRRIIMLRSITLPGSGWMDDKRHLLSFKKIGLKCGRISDRTARRRFFEAVEWAALHSDKPEYDRFLHRTHEMICAEEFQQRRERGTAVEAVCEPEPDPPVLEEAPPIEADPIEAANEGSLFDDELLFG